jgi:hypothetical protein
MSEAAEHSSSDEGKTVTPKPLYQTLYQYLVVVLIDDKGFGPRDDAAEIGFTERVMLYSQFMSVLKVLDMKSNTYSRVQKYKELERWHSIAERDVRKDDIGPGGVRGKFRLVRFFWDLVARHNIASSLDDIHTYVMKTDVGDSELVKKELKEELDAAKWRLKVWNRREELMPNLAEVWRGFISQEGEGKEAFNNLKRLLEGMKGLDKILGRWKSLTPNKEPWQAMDLDDASAEKYRTEFIIIAIYFNLGHHWIVTEVFEYLANLIVGDAGEQELQPGESVTGEMTEVEQVRDQMQKLQETQGLVKTMKDLQISDSRWNHYAPGIQKLQTWNKPPINARHIYKNWIDCKPTSEKNT